MCHEIWQVTPDKPKPCEFWNHTFAFEKTALRIIVGAVFSKPLMTCIPRNRTRTASPFPNQLHSTCKTWVLVCEDVLTSIQTFLPRSQNSFRYHTLINKNFFIKKILCNNFWDSSPNKSCNTNIREWNFLKKYKLSGAQSELELKLEGI